MNATDAHATDLAHLDISDRPRADVQVDDVINLDAGPLPPDVDPFGPEIPVTPRGRRRLLAGDRFTILRGGGRTPRAWGAGLAQWFPDASPNAAMQVVEATPDLDRYDYQFGGTFACRVAYQSRERISAVECWGDNQYGQLNAPDGQTNPALLDAGSARRPVSLYPRATAPGDLIVGYAFACGANSCWGTLDPQYGAASSDEIGNPDPSWVTSANARHRCGLSDGVECGGYNPNGETGRVQLSTGPYTWDIWSVGFRQVERLAVSRGVSYAIRFDGSLWCWGNCPSERSWIGGSARATPRPVFGLWNIAEVVVLTREHSDATCARTRDGHVRCWGRCSAVGGRCRNPATNREEDGLWDFDEPRDVVEIVAGASHFCALTLRDEVWCWGRNPGGETRPGAPESLAGYLPARVTIPN